MATDKIKKGLGRGLTSLFGDQPEEENLKSITNKSYLLVPISDLDRNRFQPRNHFDEKKNR